MNVVPASLLRVEVASELPNVPNPVVDRYIVHATRMLCDEVALWQEVATVTAANGELDLSAMDTDDRDTVRAMPRGVSQNGQILPQYLRPNPRDATTLGYYARSMRHLTLTGAPDNPDFIVTAQMRPSIATLKVPEDVARDYHDVIVHGALYRLFRMPSETWASGEAAASHYEMFMQGARQARSEVNRIYAAGE